MLHDAVGVSLKQLFHTVGNTCHPVAIEIQPHNFKLADLGIILL